MESGALIRDAEPQDSAAIATLITAAFTDAPHAGGNEAQIVAALRAAGALTLSLVAERGGALVGHIAASPATVEGRAGWFCIAPVSVAPDQQGQGIGAALIIAALDWLRAAEAKGAVLVGDPGYYRRFGFTPRPGLTAEGIPAPYLQALEFGADLATGAVSFHPAFSR
ncbi:MAG: N-acetyltransferase [Paracoccaceae bacterium]